MFTKCIEGTPLSACSFGGILGINLGLYASVNGIWKKNFEYALANRYFSPTAPKLGKINPAIFKYWSRV